MKNWKTWLIIGIIVVVVFLIAYGIWSSIRRKNRDTETDQIEAEQDLVNEKANLQGLENIDEAIAYIDKQIQAAKDARKYFMENAKILKFPGVPIAPPSGVSAGYNKDKDLYQYSASQAQQTISWYDKRVTELVKEKSALLAK